MTHTCAIANQDFVYDGADGWSLLFRRGTLFVLDSYEPETNTRLAESEVTDGSCYEIIIDRGINEYLMIIPKKGDALRLFNDPGMTIDGRPMQIGDEFDVVKFEDHRVHMRYCLDGLRLAYMSFNLDSIRRYFDFERPLGKPGSVVTCPCGQTLDPNKDISPNDGQLVCWKCGGRP